MNEGILYYIYIYIYIYYMYIFMYRHTYLQLSQAVEGLQLLGLSATSSLVGVSLRPLMRGASPPNGCQSQSLRSFCVGSGFSI